MKGLNSNFKLIARKTTSNDAQITDFTTISNKHNNRPSIPQEQKNIVIMTSDNNETRQQQQQLNLSPTTISSIENNAIMFKKSSSPVKNIIDQQTDFNNVVNEKKKDFLDDDGYDYLYDLHKTIVCDCKLPMKKMQNRSTKQGFWACQNPYGSPENCKKTLSLKNALKQLNEESGIDTDSLLQQHYGTINNENDMFPPHYKTLINNQVLYHSQVHFPLHTLSEETKDIAKIIQPTIPLMNLEFIKFLETNLKVSKINWIKHASCADRDYNHIDFRISLQKEEEEKNIRFKLVENTNLQLHPDQMLVPLHGISPHDEGWLNGDSDIIVVRKKNDENNSWVILPRLKFKNWILKQQEENLKCWPVVQKFANYNDQHLCVPWTSLNQFTSTINSICVILDLQIINF